MKMAFFILIGSVLIVSIVFGILLWQQTKRFERKALVAKKRKEQFIMEMEKQQEPD